MRTLATEDAFQNPEEIRAVWYRVVSGGTVQNVIVDKLFLFSVQFQHFQGVEVRWRVKLQVGQRETT